MAPPILFSGGQPTHKCDNATVTFPEVRALKEVAGEQSRSDLEFTKMALAELADPEQDLYVQTLLLEFHCFEQLPPELRSKIFKDGLPLNRSVRITATNLNKTISIFHDCHLNSLSVKARRPLLVLSKVNSESRKEIMPLYTPIVVDQGNRIYVNYQSDTIVLNGMKELVWGQAPIPFGQRYALLGAMLPKIESLCICDWSIHFFTVPPFQEHWLQDQSTAGLNVLRGPACFVHTMFSRLPLLRRLELRASAHPGGFSTWSQGTDLEALDKVTQMVKSSPGRQEGKPLEIILIKMRV